jgi:serine/threonine protein phosphatase PrpC
MGNTLEGYGHEDLATEKRECVTKKETECGHMIKIGSDKYALDETPSDIRFAVSSMQGWRPTMEDSHILAPSLEVDGKGGSRRVLLDHALFCVFDGHGGGFTSEFAGENFKKFLMERKEWIKYINLSPDERGDVPGVTLLKSAMKGAFYDIDNEMKIRYVKRLHMLRANSSILPRDQKNLEAVGGLSPESRDNCSSSRELLPSPPPLLQQRIFIDRSGSTAVTVLLTPSHIICCNLGDSRAILCREGTVYPLSFDHKPSDGREMTRVHEAGGFVKLKRIDGDLAVSRGLGDFRFKLNEIKGLNEQKVSSEPEIMVYPRNNHVDEFLVIGCDGIWDVLDNNECAKLVQQLYRENPVDLGKICEDILDVCLKKDSRDNMTVSVLTMPAAHGLKTDDDEARS